MTDLATADEKEESEKLQRMEAQFRQRLVISTITIFFGALLFVYVIIDKIYATTEDPDLPAYSGIGLILLLAGISHTIFWYLQTGFKDRKKIKELEDEIVFSYPFDIPSTEDLESLKKELEKLKENILPGASTAPELTNDLIEKIKNEAHKGLLSDLSERIASEKISAETIEEIKNARRESTLRIEMEIDALTRRGNLNLAAGVSVAAMGIITLTSFIFGLSPSTPELSANALKSIPNYDPTFEHTLQYVTRIALVLSIEVLAFFFLRLYKSNLEEMKYFQNEITNLESKYISLITSAQLDRSDTMHKILVELVGTERNHILEKGQSTIELRKIEHEKNQFIEITKALTSIIPKPK